MSFTIWFTGLSGAGKSTLSKATYKEIKSRGLKAELLDGDIIRSNFSQELSFSKRDRDINVRRIGFVSHLLNKNDVVSVVAAIAPYTESREQNRALLGENYIEAWCDCPLAVTAERDVKGLYKRAFAGEIENFTGVSDPYEPPRRAELRLRTDAETIDESVQKILCYLEERELLPAAHECVKTQFSEAEELNWRNKLAQLGYAKG